MIGAASADGTGAVWVFVRDAGVWTYSQKLRAPSHGPGRELPSESGFGTGVALSADGRTAVIGGPDTNDSQEVGAAWVFVRRGSRWSYRQKLTAPATGSGRERRVSEFGTAIALSAGTLLIGGPSDQTRIINGQPSVAGRGAAWVFTARRSGWTFARKLTAPSAGPGREIGDGSFGASVALTADGAQALIGAPSDASPPDSAAGDPGIGAVWTFSRRGRVWTERQKIMAPVSGTQAELGSGGFGSSVAVASASATAVIGGDADNSSAGAAWIYSGTGGSWAEQAKLTAPASGPDQEAGGGDAAFGATVALSADGGTALIAGPSDGFLVGDGLDVGAAWRFTGAAASWTEQQKLIAPTTGPDRELNGSSSGGEFGDGLALSADGSSAVIGAPEDHDTSFGSPYPDYGGRGAAWAFGLSR
jgi:hypothetical protein